MLQLDFKEPRCKLCKRKKGDHKAVTFNCPFGRSRSFPQFKATEVYTPTRKRVNNS